MRRVTAVEPSEGMREGFERAMRKEEEAALKGEGEGGGGAEVVCVDGTFEKVPVGDGEADLVRRSRARARALCLGSVDTAREKC